MAANRYVFGPKDTDQLLPRLRCSRGGHWNAKSQAFVHRIGAPTMFFRVGARQYTNGLKNRISRHNQAPQLRRRAERLQDS